MQRPDTDNAGKALAVQLNSLACLFRRMECSADLVIFRARLDLARRAISPAPFELDFGDHHVFLERRFDDLHRVVFLGNVHAVPGVSPPGSVQ